VNRTYRMILPAFALVASYLWTTPAAAEAPLRVVIDDRPVQFDAQPEVIEGNTMVPIRAVVESMGAQVAMDGDNSFTINKGDKRIKIRWNSTLAYVDNTPVSLPVPAYIKQNRTYVPLRFVGESFASTVNYEQATNTVVIHTNDSGGTARPVLRFPVISDIHVQAGDVRSATKFKAALADLNSISANSDALVINGDLTNGKPSDYEALKNALNASPHPANVWYTIGNHEFYKSFVNNLGIYSVKTFPNGETDRAAIDRFLKLTGERKVYYDRWLGGYHFLFLGSEKSRMSDMSYGDDAWLSTQQLNWLKNKLNENSGSGKPIFLFLHQPLPNTIAGTTAWTGQDRSVIQSAELRNILADHPEVIYFSGHTHYQLSTPKTLVHDIFTMVGTSSVHDPVRASTNEPDLNESEGLYVEVYGDKVKIMGRDFTRRRWIPEAMFEVPLKQ
jgi:3',5'-cyclic-AMP phosphodiesterase